MPGWTNRIAFNNGIGIEESESQEYVLTQNRPNSISLINVDGDPNGVAVGNPGSQAYDRTNGDWYRKDSGTGNTGWVLANGVSSMVDIEGDDGVAVAPDGTGTINFNGTVVANATNSKPVYFRGTPAAFLEEAQIQVGTARTGAPPDTNDAGISSFDDAAFAVDANGYVTLVGGGTAAIQFLTDDGAPAVVPDGNGEVDILGGTNITTSGTGPGNTITINTDGFAGFSCVETAVDVDPMVAFTGYVVNDAALVTLTLPSTSSFGDMFFVVRKGAGDVTIAQNAGQTIHYNNTDTTTGAGGSLDSNAQWDTIWLKTVTADTDFVVLNSSGSWTAN